MGLTCCDRHRLVCLLDNLCHLVQIPHKRLCDLHDFYITGEWL